MYRLQNAHGDAIAETETLLEMTAWVLLHSPFAECVLVALAEDRERVKADRTVFVPPDPF